jgi:uncharacterized protein (TIGR02246 family)
MTSDEEAIRAVLAQYCALLDAGEFDRWAELYDDDAVFAVPAASSEVRGRAAIRQWMADTYHWVNTGWHITANVAIAVDGDRATVVSDTVFFVKTDDGPRVGLIGRYDDVFHKTDVWRFARRESDIDPSWMSPAMGAALADAARASGSTTGG